MSPPLPSHTNDSKSFTFNWFFRFQRGKVLNSPQTVANSLCACCDACLSLSLLGIACA